MPAAVENYSQEKRHQEAQEFMRDKLPADNAGKGVKKPLKIKEQLKIAC